MKKLPFIFLFAVLTSALFAQKAESKSGTIHVKKASTSEKPQGAERNNTSVSLSREMFTVVEQMPVFPGGEKELMAFLQKNLNYPVEAKKNNIGGTVYIGFTVDSAGNILNPQVLSSPDSRLSAEALRVTRDMPKWKPGRQLGQAVSTYMSLPVRFVLK